MVGAQVSSGRAQVSSVGAVSKLESKVPSIVRPESPPGIPSFKKKTSSCKLENSAKNKLGLESSLASRDAYQAMDFEVHNGNALASQANRHLEFLNEDLLQQENPTL